MPTLTEYRRALLEEIGGGGVGTTDATGTTTLFICTPMFKNANLPTDHLAYAWVYFPNVALPQQQQVTATGVNGATGGVTVAAAYGGAIGPSAPFEYSARLPLIDAGNKTMGPSLTQCVNLGLRQLLVPGSRVDVTTVAGQQSYPLTAQAGWLDDASRIVAVYDPPLASGYPLQPTQRLWALRLDDGTPTLQFLDEAYTESSFTFQIAVQRPGHTLASGVETTSGLTVDAQTSPLSLNDVVTAAKVFAFQALARRYSGAKYEALHAQQLEVARALPTWDRVRDRLLPRPDAAVMEAA